MNPCKNTLKHMTARAHFDVAQHCKDVTGSLICKENKVYHIINVMFTEDTQNAHFGKVLSNT